MKQKYLTATLLVGMLVLAGCGGGSSGFSQADLDEAKQDGVDSVTQRDCGEGTVAKGNECVPDPDHMSPVDMIAMASKLYVGIGDDPLEDSGNERRTAVYSGDNDVEITLNIGGGSAVMLKEDKEAMVADNHDWEGKRYHRTTPASAGMYEAIVYSNVGDPKQGRKFGSTAEVSQIGDFEYKVNSDGKLASSTVIDSNNAGKVALSGVTRSSGKETFKLPDPNTGNQQEITVPGSFHGVSGNYICDTGADRNQACSATVADEGFSLSGTWTFKPSDPNARVTDMPDQAYASYGWWLHKSADDKIYTASAFHDYKGADSSTVNLPEAGTATYMGGAAGKYALASSTGGTNEAGHFTARAMLMAKFGSRNTNMVEGTIDNFKVGDAGESRAWSVKLKEGTATDQGVITGPADGTAWTMGDDSADASGEWSGQFFEQGTDDVPGVVTGTFYTEFGRDGKMVGAFGATGQ